MHLVGIGNTGCNLVSVLSKYPEYKVTKIDQGLNVKIQNNPEDYEKHYPGLPELQQIKEEVFVFLAACGNISGLSLRVLEQLKAAKISIFLLINDETLLSNTAKIQQKIVTNILQEYTRSGLVNSLYLIDNQSIENLLENIPINEYYEKLNESIAYFFHNLMYFKNTKPLLETKEDPSIANIRTIGFVRNSELSLFYSLKEIKNIRYYYSVPKSELKSNGKLLQNIKLDLKKSTENDMISRSFALYEADDKNNFIIVEAKTHIVQTYI